MTVIVLKVALNTINHPFKVTIILKTFARAAPSLSSTLNFVPVNCQ
jgi:hypothetical protein